MTSGYLFSSDYQRLAALMREEGVICRFTDERGGRELGCTSWLAATGAHPEYFAVVTRWRVHFEAWGVEKFTRLCEWRGVEFIEPGEGEAK